MYSNLLLLQQATAVLVCSFLIELEKEEILRLTLVSQDQKINTTNALANTQIQLMRITNNPITKKIIERCAHWQNHV
jgi:hypothetical protein